MQMLKELACISPTPYLNARSTTIVAFMDNWRNDTRADLLIRIATILQQEEPLVCEQRKGMVTDLGKCFMMM